MASSGTTGVQPSSARMRAGSPSNSGRSLGLRPIRVDRTRTGTRARATSISSTSPNRNGAPRTDVVGASVRPRSAIRDMREPYPDVGEVAPRVKVADADFRRLPSRLDRGDLPGKSGRRERWILPRTEMIERARNGHSHRGAAGMTAEHFLSQFAQAVGTDRRQRMIFRQRLGRPVDTRARSSGSRLDVGSRPIQCFEKMVGAADIRGKCRFGVIPGLADMRRAGAVIDDGAAVARSRR